MSSSPTQNTVTTRSARVCIELGLVWTRTSHLESRTDRPGSQSDQNDRVKKVLLTLFALLRKGPFRARVRSLAAISHLFPIGTATENTPARPVAYQVVKLELSNFGALELSVSPEASGQNHRDDFFKNDADA